MVNKAWKIFPRPLLETILNNHVQHHRVPQPLFLHGPRGVGKTTLILNRLLDGWNKGPHITGYVDFGGGNNQEHTCYVPWTSWNNKCLTPPTLKSLNVQLETCLEQLVEKGISLGAIGSQQVFTTLNKWHGINTALHRIIDTRTALPVSGSRSVSKRNDKVSSSVLWSRAVFAISKEVKNEEIDEILGFNEKGKVVSIEEKSYFREAMLSLRLAKEVIEVHKKWRGNAARELNRSGGYSRSLANCFTDWPCLLLDLLSSSAELGYFQPKLVINNIEILRYATTDDTTVSAQMYHDSFLWRLIALGINERSLPVILVTSDSYYSYRVTFDFGYQEIFISRETFGWTPPEAKLHMVSDYFSESEWKVIVEVLGSNPRHISEIYTLKQSSYYDQIMQDSSGSTFEDIVDAYLAYLQVTVVNPAMDSVLFLMQKFAVDARDGKISKDRLQFGAPWRHPPRTDNPTVCLEWAKIQLMDFVHSLVNAEFGVCHSILSSIFCVHVLMPLLIWKKWAIGKGGVSMASSIVTNFGFGNKSPRGSVLQKRFQFFGWKASLRIDASLTGVRLNYFSDYSLEILDDPSATAMLEVGLLYTQRDPPYIRPISRGIERCLVRWLVHERMQMSFLQSFRYMWQRIIRGRSYRHLMKEAGYK
ncbi:hypothetical protein IFM89_010495 [Coptis chinensis]|uniref:Uncharacterized protein n=1 Tax=Coptis chinensis TaxID=261450 RepID=A0A835GX23_9MAGN|nr:hypothetical protein IFM89_010495 [Coptis chinensis]